MSDKPSPAHTTSPKPRERGVVHADLRLRARELGLSLEDVALRAGLTRAYLYALLSGKTKDPGVNTLYRLSRALDLPAMALYRRFVQDLCSSSSDKPYQGAQVFYARHPSGGLDEEDAVVFCEDVSYPDYAVVLPGERFTKVWALQNVGRTLWRGRRLVRVDDNLVVARRMGNGRLEEVMNTHLYSPSRSVAIPDTEPGWVCEVGVEFIAPNENATVGSVWVIESAEGRRIYDLRFFCQALVTVVGD